MSFNDINIIEVSFYVNEYFNQALPLKTNCERAGTGNRPYIKKCFVGYFYPCFEKPFIIRILYE